MTSPTLKDVPASARKVALAADELKLDVEIVEMPHSTRTAEEAAAACGCDVARIVKSLVFRGRETDAPYLFLVAGNNRVDEKRAGEVVGEGLERPDAIYVRDNTGFAIGGVPPFGHTVPMRVVMDPELLRHESVWAAAGTPRCVFRVDPAALRDAIGAEVAPLA